MSLLHILHNTGYASTGTFVLGTANVGKMCARAWAAVAALFRPTLSSSHTADR